LPSFITAPEANDHLMMVMTIFLIVVVFLIGVMFLRLHTLPERIAHRRHKLQFEIVAVLGLIALFTHIHLFWIAGLILAMIDIPDFGSPLTRMAKALERIAGMAAKGGPDMAGADKPHLMDADPAATGTLAGGSLAEGAPGKDGGPAKDGGPGKDLVHA
jgi:hypothetical protein